MKKFRVLIVDDSSVIRSLLRRAISSDPRLEVVGMANDPFEARDMLLKFSPDVMTLDLELPKMDGITFLKQVMSHCPTRTIVVSALSTMGSELYIAALDAGAIDVMTKPTESSLSALTAYAKDLNERIYACASSSKISAADRNGSSGAAPVAFTHSDKIAAVAIASSTGGTEALRRVLQTLPAKIPPILIVQHMPPGFTKTFADSLAKICRFPVKEATQSEKVLPNQCLIAPGDFHMELVKTGSIYSVALNQKPHLHSVRPAADYLMFSVAKYLGENSIGIVLTGMGRDGAAGLLAMRQAGAFTIAQDEKTSVVYGMPKAAAELGGAIAIKPLEEIGACMGSYLVKKAA